MKKRYVYLVKSENGLYKIGVSNNVERRIKQLQTGSPDKIIMIDKFLSDYPFKVESTLHRINNIDNISGEWYSLDENTVNNFHNECETIESNFKCMDEHQNPFL